MQFYGQSYMQMMDLPIKAFWLMNKNIDRIAARQDMRRLSIAMCAQSSEAANQLRDSLNAESGTVVKMEAESPLTAVRDERAFAELKGLAEKI